MGEEGNSKMGDMGRFMSPDEFAKKLSSGLKGRELAVEYKKATLEGKIAIAGGLPNLTERNFVKGANDLKEYKRTGGRTFAEIKRAIEDGVSRGESSTSPEMLNARKVWNKLYDIATSLRFFHEPGGHAIGDVLDNALGEMHDVQTLESDRGAMLPIEWENKAKRQFSEAKAKAVGLTRQDTIDVLTRDAIERVKDKFGEKVADLAMDILNDMIEQYARTPLRGFEIAELRAESNPAKADRLKKTETLADLESFKIDVVHPNTQKRADLYQEAMINSGAWNKDLVPTNNNSDKLVPPRPTSAAEREIKQHDNSFFTLQTIIELGLPTAFWRHNLEKGWHAVDTVAELNNMAVVGHLAELTGLDEIEEWKDGMTVDERLYFTAGLMPFVKMCSDSPRKIGDLLGKDKDGKATMANGANEVLMAKFLDRPEGAKAKQVLEAYYLAGGYQVGKADANLGKYIKSTLFEWEEPEDFSNPRGPQKKVSQTIAKRFQSLITATKGQEMNVQMYLLDKVSRKISEYFDNRDNNNPRDINRGNYGMSRLMLEFYQVFGEAGLNYDVGRMAVMHGGRIKPDGIIENGRLVGDGLTSMMGLVDEKGRTLTDEEAEAKGVLQKGLTVGGELDPKTRKRRNIVAAEALAKRGVDGLITFFTAQGVSKIAGAWEDKLKILKGYDAAKNLFERGTEAIKKMAPEKIIEAAYAALLPLRENPPFTLISLETYSRIMLQAIPEAPVNSVAEKIARDEWNLAKKQNRLRHKDKGFFGFKI